jgi:hypothetical protein
MNKTITNHLKKIAELAIKVRRLRKKCKHKNYVSEYKSNSGNYDPSSDCYWIEFNCLDCGDTNHFDSIKDEKNYHKFAPKNDYEQ